MPAISKQTVKPTSAKKTGGIEDRIKSVVFDEDEGISLLLYGGSGTGKTSVWSTFPKPILCGVCSGGKRPGELRSVRKADRAGINQLFIEKPEDLHELVELQRKTSKYKTLVLDHSSAFYDRVLAEILGIEVMPEQKSWGMATRQQYGQATLQCKTLFREFLNLSCHRVIIAQERDFSEDVEEQSDLIQATVGAALTKSLVGWLNPACDYIAQTFIRPKMKEVKTKIGEKTQITLKPTEEVEYCLRTAPHPVYTVKFRIPERTGASMGVIVNPTYAKIKEVINQ